MGHFIDLLSIYFGDDDEAEERLVQQYFELLCDGKPITSPLLVEKADGRLEPLDEHDCAKVVAARRCGDNTVSAVVIEDPGPDVLESLRRERKTGRVNCN